jgi:hypothetical protein
MVNHHLGINPRIIPDGAFARKSAKAGQAFSVRSGPLSRLFPG